MTGSEAGEVAAPGSNLKIGVSVSQACGLTSLRFTRLYAGAWMTPSVQERHHLEFCRNLVETLRAILADLMQLSATARADLAFGLDHDLARQMCGQVHTIGAPKVDGLCCDKNPDTDGWHDHASTLSAFNTSSRVLASATPRTRTFIRPALISIEAESAGGAEDAARHGTFGISTTAGANIGSSTGVPAVPINAVACSRF